MLEGTDLVVSRSAEGTITVSLREPEKQQEREMSPSLKRSTSVLALLFSFLTGREVSAQSVPAPSAAQAQDNSALAAGTETVIVTGLKDSLLSAMDFKRKTVEVVDSIVAEDIGKLSDSNVAETMTRIPGVQGYRYGGEGASPVGVGSGLTIRGLSGQTASRVDGRAYFTAGQREFNIEGAVPGMVAGIDVFKNPTSDHIEGGIGGLVNIRTRKPLDFKDTTVSVGITTRYNELVQTVEPDYFAMVADRWSMGHLGEMGLVLSANYQLSHNRSDNNPSGGGTNIVNPIASTDTANYTAASGCNMAYLGAANTSCLQNLSNAQALALTPAQRANLVTLASVKTPVNEEDIIRTRIGFDGAFQWKVTSDFEAYAVTTFDYYQYHQNYRFMNIGDTQTVQNLTTTPYNLGTGLGARDPADILLSGQRFKSGTFIGDNASTIGGDEHRPFQTLIGAVGFKWSATDKLDVKLDLSYVTSDQKQDNRSATMNSAAGLTWNVSRDVTTSPHGISFSGPALSDPRTWVLGTYTNGTNQIWHDDGEALQLDLDYRIDAPFFNLIKFGGRYATQNENYHNYAFLAPNNLTTDGLALAANQSNGISAAAATVQDLMQGSPTNWMGGEAGYSGGFLVFSPDALLHDNVRNRFPLAGIPSANSLPEQIANRRFAREQTLAGYVVGEFAAFDNIVEGNVGVRVVEAWDLARAMVANVPGPGFTPSTKTTTRTDVLPSANVVIHLEDDLQLKLGYGKGLTRPDFGLLNPAVVVSTTAGTGNLGNPNLRPLTADSFDATLEYYFRPGSSVVVGVFDKEIKGFFSNIAGCQSVASAPAYTGLTPNGCTGGQYFITQTVNAAPGYARGMELSGTTFFDFLPGVWSHFGAQANYSYVETANPISFVTNGPLVTLPQTFQSKNNASISGFYEDDALSARLIYTYRSDFNFNGFSANPIDSRTVHGYGLLDASVSYDIGYNIDISGSVSNITNAAPNRYQGEQGVYTTPFERQHYDNGRIYSLGLRFRTGG
jgi:iron complex outermembrane receptor protein